MVVVQIGRRTGQVLFLSLQVFFWLMMGSTGFAEVVRQIGIAVLGVAVVVRTFRKNGNGWAWRQLDAVDLLVLFVELVVGLPAVIGICGGLVLSIYHMV